MFSADFIDVFQNYLSLDLPVLKSLVCPHEMAESVDASTSWVCLFSAAGASYLSIKFRKEARYGIVNPSLKTWGKESAIRYSL